MLDRLRQRLNQAAATRFSLLKRLPSITVWRTLGYLESLSEDELASVLDGCAEVALQNVKQSFLGEPLKPLPPGEDFQNTPRMKLFQAVMGKSWWSRFPDRFLKQFEAIDGALEGMVDASRLESIHAANPPVNAKAPAIRKVLHASFKERFGAKATNNGAGRWTLMGNLESMPFAINIDYGGMSPGFRYGIIFPKEDGMPFLPDGGMTLEASYGLIDGAVDFIMDDELDQLVVTMGEIVLDLATLFEEYIESSAP